MALGDADSFGSTAGWRLALAIAVVVASGCGGKSRAAAVDGGAGDDAANGIDVDHDGDKHEVAGEIDIESVPLTCPDGIKNGLETDIDCGGKVCPGCSPGQSCLTAHDCFEDVFDICTTTHCEGGTCKVGTSVLGCDDWNSCTIDSCEPAGGCAHVDVNCDDGNKCTADSCAGAVCSNAATSCDDANACTTDSCEPASGCAYANAAGGSACEDGDGCTLGDSCLAGSCKGGAPMKCMGKVGDACFQGVCEPAIAAKAVAATALIDLPAALPNSAAVVVQGKDRTYLQAAAGGPEVQVLAGETSATCAPGSQPWKVALATAPVPEALALQADGAILVGLTSSSGYGPPGFKGAFYGTGTAYGIAIAVDGSVSAPVRPAVATPTLWLTALGLNYEDLVMTGCAPTMDWVTLNDSMALSVKTVPSTLGVFHTVLVVTAVHHKYSDVGVAFVESWRWTADPQGKVAGVVENEKSQDWDFFGPFPATGTARGAISFVRTLPEGGNVHLIDTSSGEYFEYPCWPDACATPLQGWFAPSGAVEEATDVVGLNVADVGECEMYGKICHPRSLDKRGSWWVSLHYPGQLGAEPQSLVIQQKSKGKYVIDMLPSWRADTLALTTDGGIALAGRRQTSAGKSALVVERHDSADFSLNWRTSVVAAYDWQPATIERLPDGELLLVALRKSAKQQVLSLLWFDKTGAIYRERLIPLAVFPSKGILVSVHSDGSAALAVEGEGTWRFATLPAVGTWSCKPASAVCGGCADGNPCTDDGCVAGICQHGQAAQPAFAACHDGIPTVCDACDTEKKCTPHPGSSCCDADICWGGVACQSAFWSEPLP